MSIFLSIIAGSVIVVGVVTILWRYSSLRLSIPCPAWLSWLVELDNPVFRNNRAVVILGRLGIVSGMKVLDFGCGPGRLTIPLAKLVGPDGQVTAFDVQSGMLERVRDKAQAEHVDTIQLIQGAAGEGKLPSDQYDRVLLVTVLGEIPDQKAAMVEMYRSLKRGGLLSVTEVIADPHFQRRDKVTRVARSAGFVEKEFFGNRVSFTIHFEKP